MELPRWAEELVRFFKLRFDKVVIQVEIGTERVGVLVANQLANGWFRHALLNERRDPSVPEEVCMQRREITLISVVGDGVLQRIHGKRSATPDALEGYKDLVNIWKQILAFLVQISVECREGVTVHVDSPGPAALACGNEDTAVRALNILEANGYRLADAEAADPHEEHECAVSPRR